MIYLFEALWYGLLIVLKIAFWPAIIIGGTAIIARIFGAVRKAIKDSKKE